MDWNKSRAALALTLVAVGLGGCSVAGKRESPVNEVTQGSPTVLQIYRGQGHVAGDAAELTAQQQLRSSSTARPIAAGDEDTQRYWSALEPLRQRFARVPNPDLVMVVYPHLAKGKYPVPGYVTVFPMYEQTHYALPGEVQQDLITGRTLLREQR